MTYFEFIGVMLKSFSMIDNIVTSKWGKISSMYNEYLIPCGTVQNYLLIAKLRGVGEQVREWLLLKYCQSKKLFVLKIFKM